MKTGIAIALMVFAGNAWAWGALQNQSVNDFSRYCTYSDGGVLTVGSTDLCPINNMSQSDDGAGPNISIENRNVGFGTLKGQGTSGSKRYCYYTDNAVLTVYVTDLCPISDK
jgi:hypothetical protein